MKWSNGMWRKRIAGLTLASWMLPLMGSEAPAGPDAGTGSAPPARKIPGITAPDQFPSGCVDCHLNYPELKLDARISALMAGWGRSGSSTLTSRMQALAPAGVKLKGGHPEVKSALGDIPAACIKCHAKPSTRSPSFGSMMHVIHLGGLKDGHFLSIFQGECTHCHKLDINTGTWRIPSGPERKMALQESKPGARVTKLSPTPNRTAVGESLYMFCFIVGVSTVVFLLLGVVAVQAVKE